MGLEVNGSSKHIAGPGAFLHQTPEQIRKRKQNVRYREKRKALMAAGRVLLEPEEPEVQDPPGRKRWTWTAESRRKLSEAMKRAHAAKPDWKQTARLKREGWLPLDEKDLEKVGATPEEPPIDVPVRRRAYRKRSHSVGMKALLIEAIRRELHEHVRAGHELTPFHTNVLALTDYLRNEDDGNDGI